MKLLICTFLLLCRPAAAQIDKPITPDEFGELLKSARAKHQEENKVLTGVREYLNAGAGKGADLQKQAAVVHADLLICIANGDYRRTESQLYLNAAASAAQIAEQWEKKANNRSSVPSVSEESFTIQLADLERRFGQLRASKDPTPEEHTEIASIEKRKNQIREALEIYEKVRSRTTDPAKYVAAANQMRAIERSFRIQVDDSKAEATKYD